MLFYIIGILGSGTSALASLLIQMGHNVKGCDTKEAIEAYHGSLDVEDIREFKALDDRTYIIGNSFVNSYQAALVKMLKLDYFLYPQMIDRLEFGTKIQVSGSNGKTFTTALISHLLASSALIGDGSAKYVNMMEFVYEGCEYKNTFLNYHPDVLVLLNVDYDHIDFFKTKNEYEEAFYQMSCQSKTLIYNLDDNALKTINHKNKYSFSLSNKDATLYCKTITKTNEGYILRLKYFDKEKEFLFPFYAKHNIYNFLAAFLTGLILGRNEDEMIQRLKNFKRPNRRLNEYIIGNNIVINDYAHHPTQIKSLYEYLSSKYPSYKKIIVFEGHTLSRSLYFKKDYKEALSKFDKVYLYPIYYARENKDKQEKEFYGYLKYKKYERSFIKKELTYNNVVIVFAGAGIIYKEFDYFIGKNMS